MIDLHCHILPGLDDGAGDESVSLAMARAAEADGVRTIAATPHIRADYGVAIEDLPPRRAALNLALREAGIAVSVVAGGELALSKLPELNEEELAGICLGDGNYVLIESPYTPAPDLLENGLFSLQARGFRPILAHPERSPSFLSNPSHLRELVQRGVICSVTSASLARRFGGAVCDFASAMFGEGLVHNVSSDAHDAVRRPPRLTADLEAVQQHLPGGGAQREWLTTDVPAAILAGEDLPPLPQGPPGGRKRSRRRWIRPTARFLRRD